LRRELLCGLHPRRPSKEWHRIWPS
jgi:hypothetical protein